MKTYYKTRFKCWVKQIDKLSYRWFIAEHWIYRSFISPAPYCITVVTPKPSNSLRKHRFSPPKSPLLYPPARRAIIHAENGHRSRTNSPQFAKNSRSSGKLRHKTGSWQAAILLSIDSAFRITKCKTKCRPKYKTLNCTFYFKPVENSSKLRITFFLNIFWNIKIKQHLAIFLARHSPTFQG